MKITRIAGTRRSGLPCEQTIHVTPGFKTGASIRAAAERQRRGLPVDQCGKYSTFDIDGAPFCAAHAGQAALRHLLGEDQEGEQFRPMETAPRDRPLILRSRADDAPIRAIWWDNWADPDGEGVPWAWRKLDEHDQPGPPVRYGSVDGWKEVTDNG